MSSNPPQTTTPDGLLTPAQFAAQIKTKYPDYASIDDTELVNQITEKYPQYRSKVQGYDIPSVITRVANEKKADPNWLLAIGKQESGFNPSALSPKGAQGALQVMPATAARYADPDYPVDTTEGKIRAGVNYFNFLSDRYKGDMTKVLAAYNSGEGNVDQYGGVPPFAETQNYVQRVKQNYLGYQQPVSPAEFAKKVKEQYPEYAQIPDDELVAKILLKHPEYANKINVAGASGQPPQTMAQRAANVPSYQQVTPEAAAKGIARGVQDNGLRTEYENLALNADVQKGMQQHAPRLAELEAKQAASEGVHAGTKFGDVADRLTDVERRELASLQQERTNAQEAFQKQIAPQRSQDLLNVNSVDRGPRFQDALLAFVSKHGPLTDPERKELGLATNYLSKLSIEAATGVAATVLDLAGGASRDINYALKGAARQSTSPEDFLEKAGDYLQRSSQTAHQVDLILGAQNESGLKYAGGVVANTTGRLLPLIAGSMIAPEVGLPQTLLGEGIYWGGTGALEATGRGETGWNVVKAVARNLIPIGGARILGRLIPGSALAQIGARVIGNAAFNSTIAAAEGGDRTAIVTAAFMGGFMGFGHGGFSDADMRAMTIDPALRADVEQIVTGKASETVIEHLKSELGNHGLDEQQASQFVDGLKTITAPHPILSIPDHPADAATAQRTWDSLQRGEPINEGRNPARHEAVQKLYDDGKLTNPDDVKVALKALENGLDPEESMAAVKTNAQPFVKAGELVGEANVPAGPVPPKFVPPTGTPEWLAGEMETAFNQAHRMGIADRIEELSAQRKTAAEIAQIIRSENPNAAQMSPMDFKNLVRTARSAMGIPSMDQATEFNDWLNSRDTKSASEATDKGSLPVAQQTTTTPEDSAKESNNAEEIRSNQGQVNQQGPPVTAGQNVGRENIQQRAETGTIASDTQNQIEPVNEFEAPPKATGNDISNKSILEAVRALGRIQVDDETVEGGELRQFGNKEQKGQGLIGPNGKLKPDTMREYLEEAGFRDPNSTEAPGTPGSLSLDGMYELMDREQRGDKVYSAHRDSNFVDADLAKEYEQHRESGNEDAQFGHEAGLEDEWRNPESPLRQAYERIISGDDANGDEFVSVAKQYGISPESIEEHIQRATRTRESLPPVEVTPGGNDGRSEVAPEEGRVTGTKNAITDAERAERGLSPIEKDIYDEFPKVFDGVKRGIDSGKIDIRELTREWAEHPKPLSENEEAALIYDRARLYNNKEEIIDEITSAIASGDKAAEVEARVRLAPIEDAIVANEKAAVRSGTIWGRSGAIRQRMMKSDYSLANIERRFRAKTGDSPTAEQSAKFKKLSEDLEDAQRNIAKRDEIISDLEAQRWAKTEARKEAASGRRVKRAGSLDAIKKEWDGQKDALVRLLKLQGIGEPAAGGKKGLGGPEAGAVDPNLVTLPADVAKLLIEMARNRIRAGVTDAVDIVDSIHEFVKDKFDVSVRQISDAISGYGKQSKLSTDEVEVQLREVKRIRRLMSALEDAQKGEAPQRSGLKSDKPTRLVRELTRQVNEALRKNGYKLESADRSPEEQYQSALDGVKTRLRNQIQDLNERIATGQKPEGRTPIALDEEAKALKAERDGLAATLQEIDGPRRMTDEQRVASTEKALEKSIADNEARIADKRLMPDGKPEAADSPRIQELRKRNEEVKKALEDLRKADPAVLAAREASALKTYHKQLATREVEMTKTLADIKAGTYEPRAKRTQRNDPVSVEARARAGRIQDEIEKELLKAQLAKRNWTDKALDFAVKWRRNMLLSNPLTLAKLATAAASRVVVSPVEEAVGGIISHVPGVSKIAAKAPREGGFSVAAEAKAIYGYTRQLIQFAEAREIVRTGKTRLDTIYGAKGDLPPEAIEFFGRLHKLMKAPAQAAEFARSYQKRVEWALNNKMDPTDPVTQAALASSAYLDAQRAILMQDNAAVTYYRQVISRMRALDSTGKAAHPGYARALEMLLPIVKVPTNFVTETANYSLGLANALLKFRRAGWDASKLTPDEADSIMRSLKKQFVGQALFWMGYGFAGSVGGYYQQGEKRKEGAPKAGEVQLFGHNIPHFFLHSPAMEVMQLGATFRHVMDAHADYSTLGKIGSGALAGAAGLSQQVPFIETPATIADAAKSDRKFGKFAANTVGGMVIPPVAKKIAEFQDSGLKRKPGSIGEDLKMMIPATRFNQGLSRKAVPTEEQRKDEQKQKRDDKKMSPDADKIYENRMKRKGLSP